jgi:hypothetical protein
MDAVMRVLRPWCWIVAAVACGLPAAVRAADPIEYAVKAAYLAKFPFYVEWPSAAFAAPNSPIVLCVVGEDPFGSMLDEAVAGQQVQGHPLLVRRMKTAPPRDAACHIAYLGVDARAEHLRGSGMLLVTDAPAGGGVIAFVLKDNRVRFTVDDEAAAQSGLIISSKLLSVALSVKPRGKG